VRCGGGGTRGGKLLDPAVVDLDRGKTSKVSMPSLILSCITTYRHRTDCGRPAKDRERCSAWERSTPNATATASLKTVSSAPVSSKPSRSCGVAVPVRSTAKTGRWRTCLPPRLGTGCLVGIARYGNFTR
jgi:hypothetical protein